VKVCDKTCIFLFFPIINKYFLMEKRSLLSRWPSYIQVSLPVQFPHLSIGLWYAIRSKCKVVVFALQRNKVLLLLSSPQFVPSQRQRPRTIMRDIDSCSWDILAFLRTPSTRTDSLVRTNVVWAYLTNYKTRRKGPYTLHPRRLI